MIASVAVIDRNRGDYASAEAFMGALCGVINLELERAGIRGAHLIEFRWTEEDGAPPVAFIHCGPGQAPLTVPRLREALAEQRRRERAA